MLRIVSILCLALAFSGVTAGYPDGSTGNAVSTSDGTANSYGYGYSGSFSGGGPGNIPGPVFDFQKFLTGYLDSLNKYHQEFIKNIQALATQTGQGGSGSSAGAGSAAPSGVYSSFGDGGSTAFSGGSGVGGGYGGGYGSGFAGPGGAGFGLSAPDAGAGTSGGSPNLFSRGGDYGAAFASGSVGPDGVQQSAAIYPENPSSPNVNTRFASSQQPGGFRSVFTSSQTHTTNVNGKPQTVQQASTTVNDNGKITTYTAKNP